MSLLRHRLIGALDQAIDASLEQEWVWGQRDCAMWAANVIRGPLGRDPAARWRGRYKTALGFLRVLRRDGFVSLDEALCSAADACGWKRIEACEARKGDVGIAGDLNTPRAQSCVLNYTPDYWAGFRAFGHGMVPAGKIIRAWSIA